MLQIRSARLVDLPGIAAVQADAFDEKLRAIFGDQPEKIQTLLETMYRGPVARGYSGIVVAERDGRVVGTLTPEPVYYTITERRAIENATLTALGVLRTLRASFLLWMLSHVPAPSDAHIGLLAVAADSQGEGIAGRLLAQAEQWAQVNHRERLTMWVPAGSARAIHVLEREGFATEETQSRFLTRFTLGIDRWQFMVKPVRSAGETFPGSAVRS